MQQSSSELRYVGGDHWAAILEGIAELKDHFDREEQLRLLRLAQDDGEAADRDNPNQLPRPGPLHSLLLYGCSLPASRAEILAALPPKSAVNRYVSRYFNRLDLVHAIIHGPSFLREYDAFWINPSSVSIAWLGLLFSMMCLALLASDASDTTHGDPEHRALQVDLYREKTVQCLVLGEYTKGGPHVLETIVHYLYIELNLRGDADQDIWLLFALEVNLAMRMGYHRDPSHFPGISAFQGEMRRRLWATVLQGDILVSAQMGMPRMISDWKYDTKEPRNLHDSDLDESTAELPPPRAESELTPALGIIARRRLFVALGAVFDVTSAVQPCSYAQVMRVDAVLQDAAASVPAPLQPKPMALSMTDPPRSSCPTLQREEEILNMLARTRAIWMRASPKSSEAKKAAQTWA
ncbi:91038f5e-58d7-4715-8e62-aaf56b0cdac1 [Thermothielavioides terrestris]|uniref:91038f5e-58d7-4715-8e62-aaf56b0cdac1 n=1 Tax=Thermothielavioides terrestris TaxID=2587410 RepID=A0A446BE32_9PEZI|nr:91038f5e-58d7-4715-8e62-aaf56b0cdac1 [Thermothielavioides terrestris]